MLLRRLRCDELGVCQARTPFCSGCYETGHDSAVARARKVGKIKPSLKEDVHGLKREPDKRLDGEGARVKE